MTDTRKVQLEASVDASGAKKGFEDIKQGAQDMAQAVGQAGAQAGKAVDSIGSGTAGSAQKLDAATRSMVGSIQRATAAAEAGGKATAKYFESIAAQRGISPDVLRPFIEQLKQAEAGAAGAGHGMEALSFQTTAAKRELVVLTHELSQGNFKRFGGSLLVLAEQTGAAGVLFSAAALGVGALVAVAGAVAVAAAKGAGELKGFSDAATLSGNAIGVSATQFTQLRDSLAGIAGSKHAAAEALIEVAKNGALAGGNIRGIAEAAVLMERATGQSIDKTVAQFAELAKSPVDASVKLNEQFNYLTAATYKQIKALEDQGKTQEAANAAEGAYADAVKQRAQTVLDSAGTLTKGWRAVAEAAKSAWDAMLNIGREDSLGDKLAAAATNLEAQRARLQNAGQFDTTAGGAAVGNPRLGASGKSRAQQDASDAQSAYQDSFRRLQIEDGNAAALAQQAESTRARIEFDKAGDEFLTKRQRMEKEITKAQNEGAAAGASQLEIQKRVAAIRAKYVEKGGQAAGSDGTKEYDSLIKRVKERLAQQEQEITGGRALTEQEKFDVKTRADMADLMAKFPGLSKGVVAGLLAESDARQQTVDQQKEAVKAAKEVNKFLQDQDRELAADAKARTDERDKVYAGIADQRRSLEENAQLQQAEFSMVGATAQARQTAVEQLRIELQVKRDIEKVNQDLLLNEQERAKAISDIQANGERAKVQAANKATLDEWSKTADQINQSLTDALVNGFESGKSAATNLRDAIKSMFGTMVLRPIIQAVMAPVSGALAGYGRAVGGVFGGGGASGGGGVGGSIMNNTGLIGAGYQYLTGASAGASGASLVAANGVGAVGGDGLGALIAGNGGWAGVAAGGTASAAGAGAVTFGAVDTAAAGASIGAGAAGAGAAGAGAAGAGAAVLAAIPVAGWVALAAIALYSIFSKKGGAPKSEGYYNPYNSDKYYTSNSGDVAAAAQQSASGIQSQYDSLVSTFSGSDSVRFGLGYSMDPKGTAPSQLHIGVGQNGQALADLNSTAGRSQDELQQAIAQEGGRAVLLALQQSNIKGKMGEYLASLGDIVNISADQVTAAINKVQKAATEKAGLEQQQFDLTHTDLEKLTATREKERAAIDESNQALYDHVARLTDFTNTLASQKDALLGAYQSESSQLQGVITQHTEYAKSLRELRDSLSLSDAPLSKVQKTALTLASFGSTLQGAIGGNADALQSLGGKGQDYIAAVKESASSPVEIAAAVAKVQAGLTSAASSSDAKATVAQQQLDAMTQQLSALGLLNTSVLTVGDALAAYLNTQNAIAQESLNYTALLASQQTTATPTPVAVAVTPADSIAAKWAAAYGPSATMTTSGSGIGAYAAGGYAPAGFALVGENGPELVDFKSPGRVYTSEQTKGMLSGGSDVATELAALRVEVSALRSEARVGAAGTVGALEKLVTIEKKRENIGMPPVRATA